jgi:hypothetical protein
LYPKAVKLTSLSARSSLRLPLSARFGLYKGLALSFSAFGPSSGRLARPLRMAWRVAACDDLLKC